MRPELSDFEGVWRIERGIRDHLANLRGWLSGEAVFTPEAAGLVYREIGRLHLPGRTPMRAERTYLWRVGEGGEIAVAFADGRRFHDISPETAPTAEHPCGTDLYTARYDFTAWPAWSVTWHVTGPRKDHTMLTHFCRERDGFHPKARHRRTKCSGR